jgi:hypothetical protein
MRTLLTTGIRTALMQANPGEMHGHNLAAMSLPGSGKPEDEAVNNVQKALEPFVKPIIEIADKLNTTYGVFQRTLFNICRKFKTLDLAEMGFRYVQGQIEEHFAIKAIGGMDKWMALPREEQVKLRRPIGAIDGLSSWTVVKSKLLAGYEIRVRLGDKVETVGALDPTDSKYAGPKGSAQWLSDIQAIIEDVQKAYQAKLKAETDAKIAGANASDDGEGGEGGSNGLPRNRGQGGLDFTLPEVVSVSWDKLKSALHEAIKAELKPETIAGVLNTACANITREVTAQADATRAKAAEHAKQKPTPEQAKEMRQALAKAHNIAADVGDEETANDLAALLDGSDEEIQGLDDSAFEDSEAIAAM